MNDRMTALLASVTEADAACVLMATSSLATDPGRPTYDVELRDYKMAISGFAIDAADDPSFAGVLSQIEALAADIAALTDVTTEPTRVEKHTALLALVS